MLVGVNALALAPGRGGGAERFLRNVLVTMRDVQPHTRFVIFTDAGNHASFEGYDRVCIADASRLGPRNDTAALLGAPARQAAVDLLFSPLTTAPAKSPVPVVAYALDLRQWEADHIRKQRRGAASQRAAKRVCAAAAALVVPSTYVQMRCLELLEIGLDKIVVAPLGVHEVFATPQPALVEQPYLLAVGDTHEFKNTARLQEVFAHLRGEAPHTLVVVGRPCEAEPKDWGPGVLRFEHCPLAQLAGLYQGCDMYIQPSLYEGSGVTVLEAMRAGAPVATSRTGGIPEVAGDAPIYFNPNSPASMLGAVRRVISEGPDARRLRVRAGLRIATDYTWEKCAWKTLAAFKRA